MGPGLGLSTGSTVRNSNPGTSPGALKSFRHPVGGIGLATEAALQKRLDPDGPNRSLQRPANRAY